MKTNIFYISMLKDIILIGEDGKEYKPSSLGPIQTKLRQQIASGTNNLKFNVSKNFKPKEIRFLLHTKVKKDFVNIEIKQVPFNISSLGDQKA